MVWQIHSKLVDHCGTTKSINGKTIKFMWSTECEEVFIRLRALLATAPVLSRPSDEHEFTLQVDASNCGLGCVLTPEIDGIERVVSYARKTEQTTRGIRS